MAKKSPRTLSDDERETRRRQDRERLKRAAEELLSSDGWARWVRTRATFHVYSLNNTLLLAHQCAARGMVPTRVAGFRAWVKLGRAVRRGEGALRILAPVTVKERDERGHETDERRIFFKTAFVWDVSQTEPLPGVEPAPLEPPSQPLTGNSHAHLLGPLQSFAESLGYSVSVGTIAGSAGGWCDAKAKRIVVDAGQPPNAQVRILIHEIAHSLGIDYQSYSRAQSEVIVDTVTFVSCSSVGLAVDGESIPYVAGWGENGALEAATEFAETIDAIARRIEDAALISERPGVAQCSKPNSRDAADEALSGSPTDAPVGDGVAVAAP